MRCGAVEKKKAEPLRITDNDDKKKKSQRVVSRLEKDLADATKELQTLATPSKMMVAVFVMVVMFSVQKRCEADREAGRQTLQTVLHSALRGWFGRFIGV